MNLNKMKKGFTLIELMIVVAIIGILAAIAIPKFADLVNKAKEAKVKANLGNVRSAISMYYGGSEGVNPTNLFTALVPPLQIETYLPANGSSTGSLGLFEMPKSPSGFTGHNNALYQNCNTVACVDNDLAAPDGVAVPIEYHVTAGNVAMNCSHLDYSDKMWSSY